MSQKRHTLSTNKCYFDTFGLRAEIRLTNFSVLFNRSKKICSRSNIKRTEITADIVIFIRVTQVALINIMKIYIARTDDKSSMLQSNRTVHYS